MKEWFELSFALVLFVGLGYVLSEIGVWGRKVDSVAECQKICGDLGIAGYNPNQFDCECKNPIK